MAPAGVIVIVLDAQFTIQGAGLAMDSEVWESLDSLQARPNPPSVARPMVRVSGGKQDDNDRVRPGHFMWADLLMLQMPRCLCRGMFEGNEVQRTEQLMPRPPREGVLVDLAALTTRPNRLQNLKQRRRCAANEWRSKA
jgi:hypothetical protein